MKKGFILLVFAIFATTSMIAQSRPKVGLVLSGGGAKGAAHIGAIRAIESTGIPIDFVAGTSMGAIVGGLYSIGYTTDEMDSIFRHQDWVAVLGDQLSRRSMTTAQKRIDDTYILSLQIAEDGKFTFPSGILAAQNVFNMLNQLTIGYHGDSLDFNNFPIPFACVAFDVVSGNPVVFHKGNLPLAIRASMSIPWAFEPVELDSMVLLDGGINNNFPTDVAKEMGADFIIGVDVSAPPQSAEEVNSIGGIILQLTEIIGEDNYRPNVENTDIYIRPEVEPYGTMSFTTTAIDSLISRGYEAALLKWDDLMALKEQTGSREQSQQHKRLENDQTEIEVGTIKFTGLEYNSIEAVLNLLSLDENSVVTAKELGSAIERLRGSGAFDSVSYMVGDSTNNNSLTIIVKEKKGINLDVGIRFDTERLAALILNTKLLFGGVNGAQIGITTRLSDNPYLQVRLTSSSWLVGRFGLQYQLKYNNYRLNQNANLAQNIDFLQHTLQMSLSEPPNRWFRYNIGARYEYFELYNNTQNILNEQPNRYLTYFASWNVGTFDDAYFPTRGIVANMAYSIYTDDGLQYQGADPFHSVAYYMSAVFTPSERLAFIPSIAGRTLINGADAPYFYRNHIGGQIAGRYTRSQIDFTGSSGITEMESSVITAKLNVRFQLSHNHFLSLMGGYGLENKGFFEMFNYENAHSIWGASIKYAYRTPFGPISIDIGYSTITQWGVYLNLGKTF